LSWMSLGTLKDSTGGVTGTDVWTFSAADKSFDYLAAGEKLTLTYLIQVDDHHGGVVTQPVTITITGTNDVPTFTTEPQTATIAEQPDT
ncbi:VCBS domain-containing protein, partial [Acinetobacter baumannii]